MLASKFVLLTNTVNSDQQQTPKPIQEQKIQASENSELLIADKSLLKPVEIIPWYFIVNRYKSSRWRHPILQADLPLSSSKSKKKQIVHFRILRGKSFALFFQVLGLNSQLIQVTRFEIKGEKWNTP